MPKPTSLALLLMQSKVRAFTSSMERLKNDLVAFGTNPKTILSVAFFLIAALLYDNTESHRFVFDDRTVVADNHYVRKGFDGFREILTTPRLHGYDGRSDENYRPIPLLTHALEVQVFGLTPAPGHIGNILLFALTASVLFLLLAELFGERRQVLVVATCLLFISHPIHTEVVANIKSRDELLFLFFCLLSAYLFLQHRERRAVLLFFSYACYTLALFSKETAIAFVVFFPMCLYWFRNKSMVVAMRESWVFFGLVLIYLTIRHIVLSHFPNVSPITDVLNNPLVGVEFFSERMATAFVVLWRYLLLLNFPYPLVSDYSYNQIPVVSLASREAVLSIVVYASILTFALCRISKRDPISFCILYFVATILPVSNILFLVGTIMAERFLYAPSLGYCLAIGIGVEILARRGHTERMTTFVLLGMVLAAFSVRTVVRNGDWKDEKTLFQRDIKYSPQSAKIYQIVGFQIFQDGKFGEAVHYLEKATEIYPTHEATWVMLGETYELLGRQGEALDAYGHAVQVKPNYQLPYFRMSLLYRTMGDLGKAQEFWDKGQAVAAPERESTPHILPVRP
jgi:hypothetical protein